MRRTTTFAMLASVLMLVSIAAPAMAIEDGSMSVSVSQNSSGDATVSVTGQQNNSSVAVDGASVTVETVDPNATYQGSGEYTSDANGTVSLSAPNQTVDVSVTASYDNQTASTTATLQASSTENETEENETDDGNSTAFGQEVSSFVHALQSDDTTNSSDNETSSNQVDGSKSLGVVVATFVTENNPGNAPDHAGPPAWLLDDSVNKTTGPPDDKGNDKNKTKDKGNDKDKGKNKGKNKDKGGPPDHANSSDDGDDEEDEEE